AIGWTVFDVGDPQGIGLDASHQLLIHKRPSLIASSALAKFLRVTEHEIKALELRQQFRGLSSKWTENRVKPGRGSHFFLPYRIFPPSITCSPSLRNVPSGATCRRAFAGHREA